MVKQKISEHLKHLPELPFKIELSFESLFEHWENVASSEDSGLAAMGKKVLQKLEQVPELREPVSDMSIIGRHEEEIQLLMSAVFPPALGKNEIKAAGLPFTSLFFNHSERFFEIIKNAGPGFEIEFKDLDADIMYIFSCIYILNVAYNQQMDSKRPFYFDIPDKKNDALRHYRAFINADFMKFELLNKSFKLEPEAINKLINNFDKPELWKKIIPPETFRIRGFTLITIFDVTADVVMSDLKTELLNNEALHKADAISRIQSKLQTLLNIPDLKFGFAFIDENDLKINSLKNNYSNSIILSEQDEIGFAEGFCEHATHSVFKAHKTVALSDIEEASQQMDVYIRLLSQGFKSYIVSPVLSKGKVIGIFELGAMEVNQLNSVTINKLQDVLPLFTYTMERIVEEYQTKLELIVQENYTAIHPSVEWRFLEAAENLLKAQQALEFAQIENIVFEDVYPLYGQSDIKGSSTERNMAIQEDLVSQLNLAAKVLNQAAEIQPMPIFHQLLFHLNTYKKSLQKGLNAGDEVNMLDFLKLEVYPVFDHIRTLHASLETAVSEYAGHLDSDMGVIYRRRKDYEQSVQLINEKLSDYIDKQQQLAQHMFPHYFEKYKTDGVEFNIYIGQSIVKHKSFHKLHLHNLRLWQLITMCGLENVMHQLKPTLKVPLDVASLVLVHSSPLSVTFRMDEKRFDVDGAYNVRYEITKKRIDKALIKGTTDRLTVPGKIAIVYSQIKDVEEYLKYIEYLQSIDMLGEEVEQFELEELQGASGLQALRVTVNYDVKHIKKALKLFMDTASLKIS